MNILSDKKQLFFTGAYLSFLSFILSVSQDWSIGIIVFKVLAIVFLGLFLLGKKIEFKPDFEKLIIASAVFLFQILILWRNKIHYTNIYDRIFNTGSCLLLIIICSVYITGSVVIYIFPKFKIYKESAKQWLVKNKLILLVISGFALLSVEIIHSWVIGDAWVYYKSLEKIMINFNSDLSGVYDLYMCNHVSLGYTFYLVFSQLLHEGTASVHVVNIILASISILAYYGILKKLLGDKLSNGALATMLYVFSPFVFGIVGNFCLDNATMYFAVIFVACCLYHYECLSLIFAFMFCFTKETAVIYYVMYILAKVICEYAAENGFKPFGMIKAGFLNVRNYLYAAPVFLWMVLYKLNDNTAWGGESTSTWNNDGFNCFGFSDYVNPLKTKQILFMNFNWIFWLIIIAGIILIIIKKIRINKDALKALLPIGTIVISVMIVGCIYITYLLPRYIVPLIPFLYLFATVIAENVVESRKKALCVFYLIIVCLLFSQNYYAVDPVMDKVFPSILVGNSDFSKMYWVGKRYRADDHIVYGRQNLYWTEIQLKTLDKAGYNGDRKIVYPAEFDPVYDVWGGHKCLWNTETQSLETYDESKPVPDGCRLMQISNIDNARYDRYITYIIPRWCDVDWDYISDKKILKQGEVEHKGFSLEYMVLDAQMPLEDSNYIVSPKQNITGGLTTDGTNVMIRENAGPINVCAPDARYQFNFQQYPVVLDVKNNEVDENGTIWVYENLDSNAQKFILEKQGDYYIISWGDYALTYDSDNNSVRLTLRTGNDDQLWLFH